MLKQFITNFSNEKNTLFPFRDKEKACIFAPINNIPLGRNKTQRQIWKRRNFIVR